MHRQALWRWVFFIGAVLIALAVFVFGGYDDPDAKPVALVGLAFEAVGLVGLLAVRRGS